MTGIGWSQPSPPRLRSPKRWWWRWLEDERVIAWGSEGATIAFREEFDRLEEHVAASLPEGRVPPAGSIILLLAAFRDAWDGAGVRAVINRTLTGDPEMAEARRTLGPALDATLDALQKVHDLPADLRSSPAARNVVAAIVFESAPGSSRFQVDAWSSVAAGDDERFPADLLEREIEPLLPGLRGVNERAVRLRLATGLERLPERADAPEIVPAGERPFRGIPPELLDHPETRGIARVALQVMAVVALPRALDAPRDLPEGGIADIANRGPLDRLLLSELAHDESTLAARLALGEALYHRRERAAPAPPRQRIVLLDSGLRMWGLPRAFATSVALALRAQPGGAGPATLFRAAAEGVVPVDVDSPEGIVDHLRVLETAAHPGGAIGAFAAAIGTIPGGTDAVIVTCAEVLADPEFERLLAASAIDPLHLLSVARDGRLRLLARTRRGSRLVKEATLDLGDLLGREACPTLPEPARGSVSRQDPDDLPAIFRADPFPLRLPFAGDPLRSWGVEDVGVFTYTTDGRLLVVEEAGRWHRQLSDRMPGGALFACQSRAIDGVTTAVVGWRGAAGIESLRIDCTRHRVERVPLRIEHPQRILQGGVTIVDGTVLVRTGRTLAAYDPAVGAAIDSCTLPRGGVQHGRIIVNTKQGTILLSARPVRFGRIFGRGLSVARAVFVAEGASEVTVVDGDGQIRDVDGTLRHEVRHGLDTKYGLKITVSRSGRSFSLQKEGPYRERLLVEVATGRVMETDREAPRGETPRHLECDASRWFHAGLSVRRATGVFLGPAGMPGLVFSSADGLWLEVVPDDARPRSRRVVRWRRNGSPVNPSTGYRAFVPCRWSRRYPLLAARYADGTTIWFDGRSLLHLRSSLRRLPEVTLVAHSGECSGWLSDGRVFGSPQILGGRQPTDTALVWETVLRPLAAAIRE